MAQVRNVEDLDGYVELLPLIPLNIDAVELDTATNTVVKYIGNDSPLSLCQLAKDKILAMNVDKFLNKNALDKDLRLWFEKFFGLKPKTRYNPGPFTVLLKFVEGRNKSFNYMSTEQLILVGNLFTRETADNLFANFLNTHLNIFKVRFDQKHYWRNQLLKFEHSKYWFALYKFLYLNCSTTDDFVNITKTGRKMKICITPNWYRELNKIKFFDVKETFEDIVEYFDRLILAGDVELNPGPVMSRFMRYNNSSMNKNHVAQGPVDEMRRLNNFLSDQLPSVIENIKLLLNDQSIAVNNTLLLADEKIKEDLKLLSENNTNHLNAVSRIQSNTMKTLVVIALIGLMSKVKYYKTAMVVGVITLLSLFGVPDKLVKMIEKFFGHEAESFTTNDSLGPLIGSIICYFIIGKLPSDSSLEKFSKKTNNMSRGLSGMLNLHRDIGKLWTQIKDFVMEQINPMPEGFMSMEAEMLQWMKDIEHYVDIIVKKKSAIVNEQIIKISNLLKQGLKLRHWAFTNKCTPDVCRNISDYIRTAEQLYNYADKNNTLDGGQRQRPLCIVLFGESQIGKSGLIYPLAQDLCYAGGYRNASDIEEQIYARQPETEFWDGYKGQFIVVRDDCLAAVDDVSNPNPELHETIREMNDFPYHLHMAALEDKNSFYTSKVGIMTINDINSPIRSLTYPEAFYNRISDNIYQVVPAPEFQKVIKGNGIKDKITLDLSKVRTRLDKLSEEAGYRVPITTDIYNFVKYKKVIDSGKTKFCEDVSEKVLNYSEFSKLMCKQLLQKQDDFAVKKNFMNQRLISMQAQVNDEEFFECYDNISNYISERICKGMSMLDIECELLASPRAEEYLEFKRGAQEMQTTPAKRLKYYSEEMYERACSSIKSWFNKLKQTCVDILEKYPALKYIFMIGTTAVMLFAMYKLIYKDETVQHFVIDEAIDEETYDKNCKWMNQQKLSFSDRMMYEKTNLMMRYPEEKETIDKTFISEGIQSPSNGKHKNLQKHRIEAIPSPSSGKQAKLAKHKIESTVPIQHESEGSSDENAVEIALTVMRNNMYSMTYVNGKGKEITLGNAIALSGYNYLIPYHFVKYLLLNEAPLNTKLNLSRINYNEQVFNSMASFELSDIVNKDGTLNRAIHLKYGEHELDAIIFNVSTNSNVTLHRSILKHFILKEELGRLQGNMSGLLLSYHNDNGQIAKIIRSLNDVHNYEQELKISVEDFSYIHRAGYLYNGDTMKGDCGGPLIIKSNSLIRKIIGIHISGAAGEGYSAKLYQELLQEHIDKLSEKLNDGHRVHCYLHIDNDMLTDGQGETPNGVFVEIGKVKTPLYQASRSVLKPSLIHGEITEPITKPAHLRPFSKGDQVIDPALKGLEKCGGISPIIQRKYCDMAVNYITQKITIDQAGVGYISYARVLSYEEAIMGNDDLYISAICRSTSPGYPFNSDVKYKNNKPGKQHWMGNNENFDFTSVAAIELKRIVEELEVNCLNGVITGVICADTMKDERRPIAKVDEGKTRMFAACPMHFVVLFRKYYLGFAAFIMHNRNLNGIAVGTNPYNKDWDQIVRQITRKGKKVLAGDFSNYDGTLNSQVLWLVFEIIDEFYKQNDPEYCVEHRNIRYSLWLHIVNSIHIHGDNLYQWTHSQPSGNPFTVIINSIYNLLILVIAYLITIDDSEIDEQQKKQLSNTMSFDKYVSPIVYGDDNILNISDNISEIFNQLSLTKSLKKVGHDYTEETKDGRMHAYRELSEISFLKRKFIFDEDTYHYVAPLDKSVIYEMLNWVRGNSVDSIFLLKSNIETALCEMSLHGCQEYNTFVNFLKNNKKVTHKVKPFIPTYGEVRSKIEHMDAMGGFSA